MAHGLLSTLATGSFGSSSVASGPAGPMSFSSSNPKPSSDGTAPASASTGVGARDRVAADPKLPRNSGT